MEQLDMELVLTGDSCEAGSYLLHCTTEPAVNDPV